MTVEIQIIAEKFWRWCFLLFESGSPDVTQADFELITLPALPLSAGMTGVCHHIWIEEVFF